MVQSSAGSTTCLYWAIRGSLRTVEALVSAAREQLERDRRCSNSSTPKDVYQPSRPCRTPNQKSPWGRMFGTSVAETVSSTDSDLMGGSVGPGKHPVPGITTRTHTFGRVRIMWRRSNRLQPWRVWGTSMPSRRMATLCGTRHYQMSDKHVGNLQFRSMAVEETRSLTQFSDFRSMHHGIRSSRPTGVWPLRLTPIAILGIT